MTRLGLVCLVGVLVACGGSDETAGDEDAGSGDARSDGTNSCSTDEDCDDGEFCTGVERCMPGTSGADARGCLPGEGSPCETTQSCDEAEDRCATECDVEPDADGDGADSLDCGGTDCDDGDPRRFPGNTEVCDVDNVDEDCDPRTFGFRDSDGDTAPDNLCCNMEDGETHCGTDCDDANPGAHPSASEVCDGIDNDCDGMVDEGVLSTFYLDMDDDGRGVTDMTMEGCNLPDGYALMAGDCDDEDPRRSPSNVELCDGEMIDENCDDVVNPPEQCMCSGADSRSCSEAGLMGPCASGTQDCLDGTWGDCSIAPSAEICNGQDDDCNGSTDETFTCVRSTARACTTGCGTAGEEECVADCTWGACRASAETCNFCDDDGDGNWADDRQVADHTHNYDLFGSSDRETYGHADSLGLYDGSVHNSVGAAYYANPVRLGFGTLVFEVNVNTARIGGDLDPERGWAAVVFDRSSGSGFVGSASVLGVPRARNGYSVEWSFNGASWDRLRVRELYSSSGTTDAVRDTSTPELSEHLDDDVTGPNQRVIVKLTPDVPETGSNEMVLRVEHPVGTAIYQCSGSSCRRQFVVGQEIWLGVTGANGGSGQRTGAYTGSNTTIMQPQSCLP